MNSIQKEREAFQKFCEENFDFERHEQTYFDEQTQCYENDIGEDTESINMAWSAWQARAKAQAVPEWISVNDKLPPANILVLGMSQTPRNIFNIYNVMALDEFEEADVTHWMPLPDAPQEST
ncbi:DUF551 domain-containing protein [Acinetobacter radioresistens]|uniref:DUF551 domain-containing protein n=1 Tax=Acinetobacter radioresistens TaxID=40216 RepID=UPI00061950EE|nr:DUF551 domain-containing protein [Acinetobacter radioresistens]